ncbi:DUF2630 family protein [Actinomycetospora sp. NBRC 106378]|uniref:DUF2630 family protein n=1 Tax=Actinomycetospora sp. NBRC 106378 TaxID=3032208 RepID=UPI0024A4F4CA|nr:DUF2630 family protein [Actinomycetospora sp. NBRC 106378]GLZ56304.1 hypothetical protein Acsp07_59210 [Actinomycetospora sp. NBRC 106378]
MADEPRTDAELARAIDENAEAEHALRNGSHGGLGEEDTRRLHELQVERDRLYDLKRQRQAQRDAGQDPGEAHERDAGTVEGYRQ